MKKYIYRVAGYEFEETELFGNAWREAKAKAKELHAPIFRTMIQIEESVYCKGGVFFSKEYYDKHNTVEAETFEG